MKIFRLDRVKNGAINCFLEFKYCRFQIEANRTVYSSVIRALDSIAEILVLNPAASS